MGIEQDYDINNVAKQVQYMEFGRFFAPFLTGDNWGKLREARTASYEAEKQESIDVRQGRRLKALSLYNDWFDMVYEAMQEEIKRKEADRKRQEYGWEQIRKRAEQTAPAMGEAMAKMFNEIGTNNDETTEER